VNSINNFTQEKIHEAMAVAQSHRINLLSDHRAAIIDQIQNGHTIKGLRLPWEKVHEEVGIPVGVTILAGANASYKSTLASQILLWAAKNENIKVGLASFEMTIADLGEMMCQQTAGSNNPTLKYYDRFEAWAEQKVWVFDQLGSITPERVLGAVHAFGLEGCKLVCVDSLMMCSVGGDSNQNEKEREFVASLIGLARTHDMAVMLVHHLRKPSQLAQGQQYIGSKWDIRGSGQVVDLAALVLLSADDQKKTELIIKRDKFNQPLTDAETEYVEKHCDLSLTVAKNRYGPFQGRINLWRQAGRNHTGSSKIRGMRFDL
jgi:replicative DNA helicase